TRSAVLLECSGEVVLELDGAVYRLEALINKNPEQLFVLFADETNRDSTYGGGRFLYAPMPKDGKLIIDFNRACNPACVFNELAICPLPPAKNRLRIRVEAGEKYPRG